MICFGEKTQKLLGPKWAQSKVFQVFYMDLLQHEI